jgi:hypothetical protein
MFAVRPVRCLILVLALGGCRSTPAKRSLKPATSAAVRGCDAGPVKNGPNARILGIIRVAR